MHAYHVYKLLPHNHIVGVNKIVSSPSLRKLLWRMWLSPAGRAPAPRWPDTPPGGGQRGFPWADTRARKAGEKQKQNKSKERGLVAPPNCQLVSASSFSWWEEWGKVGEARSGSRMTPNREEAFMSPTALHTCFPPLHGILEQFPHWNRELPLSVFSCIILHCLGPGSYAPSVS